MGCADRLGRRGSGKGATARCRCADVGGDGGARTQAVFARYTRGRHGDAVRVRAQRAGTFKSFRLSLRVCVPQDVGEGRAD